MSKYLEIAIFVLPMLKSIECINWVQLDNIISEEFHGHRVQMEGRPILQATDFLPLGSHSHWGERRFALCFSALSFVYVSSCLTLLEIQKSQQKVLL